MNFFLFPIVFVLLIVGCSQNITENNDYQSEIVEDKESTLIKTKEEGNYVYYDGTIIISGKYKEFHPNTLFGEALCFYADEETGYLIPRDPHLYGEDWGDERIPWFCFSNQDEAKEMFEINDEEIFSDETINYIEGNATIEVSNYKVNKMESSVSDVANLDKIISKEKYIKQYKE